MKIPGKQEIQQTAINHSSDIDFYKKCAAKLYFFLVNDTAIAPDKHLRFKRSLLGRM